VATESGARRGLIVDWGGVLTTNVFASFEAFCLEERLPPDRVAVAFRHDPEGRALLEDLECGRLTETGFEEGFAKVLGLASGDGLIDRLFRSARDDHAMQDAVAAIRRCGIRTALLSNSWGMDWYDRRRWAQMFDQVVVSGEHGVRKPEPAIYQIAVDKIGLAPDELVFVDDLGGNLKPARAMGIATVRHIDAATTVRQLEDVLGVAVT
jgi:epoxide hydrolase-like predicted phosphatase